jgi:hypothetical protein
MEAANQQGGDLSSQVMSNMTAIDSVINPFSGADASFGSVGGGHLAVNHDNVLQAGKVIQQQVDQLNDIVRMKTNELRVGPFAEDFVSLDVADSWNKLLSTNPDSYANRINDYIDSLEKLAGQLKTAAQQYGYTEDQIKDSFGAQE